MKSQIYPFSKIKKDYPNGSYIIKESFDNNLSTIEYDTENLIETLNEQHFIKNNGGSINKDQLQKLLYLITKNIVEISF